MMFRVLDASSARLGSSFLDGGSSEGSGCPGDLGAGSSGRGLVFSGPDLDGNQFSVRIKGENLGSGILREVSKSE